VQVTLTGINQAPLAKVEISECGNAYSDNSPLPSLTPGTDCKVIDTVDVSVPGPWVYDEVVIQSGIGLGNRSCIKNVEAAFSCTLLVTHMVNQLMSPLPPPVPIEFASDVAAAVPAPTTTTAAVVGAPAILGGPAYVHVAVTTSNTFFKPEGNVAIDVDGVPTIPMTPLGIDGTVTVSIGSALGHGPHSVAAHFAGNGSFAPSDSSSSPFSVINADNVSIGDVVVQEGNFGLRKIFFPVVLSQSYPQSVAVRYAFSPGATDAFDLIAPTGNLSFPAGTVVLYVSANVVGDTAPEANEAFTINLSLIAVKSRDYEIRRATGTGTILDDDTSPSGPVVSVGDDSMQEGNTKGGHYIKLPLTLSDPNTQKVTVTVTLSSANALHAARFKGGDWNGAIVRSFTFLPGVVRRNIGILTYPDSIDEPDLTIQAQINSVTVAPGGFPVAIGRANGVGTILSDE
jgi:hypothetical protein